MKRGVGIKFQLEFFDPEKFKQWAFDNVGQPNDRFEDKSIIVRDESKGVYFTYNDTSKLLRIALWTDLKPEDAWQEINPWAIRVARECECNLSAYMVDLYEYDEQKKGYRCIYDGVIPGEKFERQYVGPDPKEKKVTTTKKGNC